MKNMMNLPTITNTFIAEPKTDIKPSVMQPIKNLMKTMPSASTEATCFGI